MNRAPAFQFYADEHLDFKMQRLSLAAQGASMKLRAFMWRESSDQSPCHAPVGGRRRRDPRESSREAGASTSPGGPKGHAAGIDQGHDARAATGFSPRLRTVSHAITRCSSP